MRTHVKRPKRLLALCLVFAGVVALGQGCMRAPGAPDPVVEVLEEIDAYRGDGVPRRLDHTLSQDATYLALDDQATTAAVQFSGPICRISLTDVLLTTLKNNRGIRIQDYSRSIAADGIDSAKSIYDLLITASYGYQKSEVQTPVRVNPDSPRNGLATSRSRGYTLSLALQQLLPTGGVLSLGADRVHSKSYSGGVDPWDRVTLGGSIVQPLLRGFGPAVTNAPIHIARLNEKIAVETFRDELIDDLAQAVNQYWDLVFAIENHKVQKLSLERAQELLRIATIKRDTGVEPPNVVLQAQAEVSVREASLIQAIQSIADASDQLKRTMNIAETSEQWDYNLTPIDRPDITPYDLNENAIHDEALAFRPDYRSAKLALEIAEIEKRVAKNSRLPSLDATAGYRIMGLEDSFHGAVDNAETADFETWNAGVEFVYPLQNRQARAAYRQALKAVEQQEEILRDLEDAIRLEVRSAVRSLETNLRLTAAYQANVEAEAAKLDSQQKRFDVGFATIFEVLQFQEDLATAEVNYLNSKVNYNKAVIEVQKVKASFLGDYRLVFLDSRVQTSE
ncbi:TolC family protein [Candidatus Sumerlaeota bacterium]|nr:TolC family protein [Candidatus Sumerlaeota bacterium]